ncbi:MAG TPA: GtrA family protein [Candidatus Paceibacterota bacterium]|nr:GtrA family protein [Candidatus Paceibacterota bacterium]
MAKYWQVGRYLIAGSLATGTNLGVLYLCVNYLGMWYLTSAIISFCFGVVVSYLLQKFWTFQNYSKEGMHKQFTLFFFFALTMLGVNTLLMYFFVDILTIWYMLSQALAAIIIAFINYTFFNKVVFRKTAS